MKIFEIISMLFKLFIKNPREFVNQINKDNYKTLKSALLNESPDQIFTNAKSLLKSTRKIEESRILQRVTYFTKRINFQNQSPLLITFSHEASRTGAPLIILEFAKIAKLKHGYNIIQILCKGGEIIKEFEEIGYTYTLDYYSNNKGLKIELEALMNQLVSKLNIPKNTPIYINSEGSTKCMKFLHSLGFQNQTSLIHELANYYPNNSWNHIEKYSKNIVFPATFVKDQALIHNKISENKVHVIPQGLLKPELYTEDIEISRAFVRRQLNIPETAHIILGCGSKIARKGTDLFVTIAINYLLLTQKRDVHFVWLGDSPMNELQVWLGRDIEISNLNTNIHLAGQVKDTSKWFVGSDIFLLTSRGDPLPCVIYEAIAAKLHIILYKGTTGYSDLMGFIPGTLLEFIDIPGTIRTIEQLIANDQSQSSQKQSKKLTDFLDMERYTNQLIALS